MAKTAQELVEQIARMETRDESDDPDQGWELDACETLGSLILEARELLAASKPPRPRVIDRPPHARCKDLRREDEK